MNDSLNGNHKNGKSFLSKILLLLHLKSSSSLKETVEEAIEEHEAEKGSIDQEEKDLLRNVLTFSELEVEDVMIPRADIVSISKDITLDELKKVIIEKAHTRLPVHGKSLDDILGFIHVKDLVSLLADNKSFKIKKMIRRILFVPPSMKATDLLVKMQVARLHMAVVIDEYGGSTGLVTLEDLVEEIVGEIEDEHDVAEEELFTKTGGNVFEASARINIEDLEEKLGTKLTDEDDEDYDTLGGLIFHILGHVPAIGEVAKHNCGIEFEIKDADARHIKRVVIRKKK